MPLKLLGEKFTSHQSLVTSRSRPNPTTSPIMSQPAAAPLDPIFRNYTPEQAAAYAGGRGDSAADVVEELLNFHLAGKGQSQTALDVGCGTGQAMRVLARHFDRMVRVDPSGQMIDQGRRIGGSARSGELNKFEVVAAEELDSSCVVSPESVDLLTAAMAVRRLVAGSLLR